MTARRALHLLLPALAGAATMAVLIATASADPGLPVSDDGLSSWWQRSGALAGPIVGVVAVLLVVLERLSSTRWPGLAWLRRGSIRAYLSLATGATLGLLPAVADGTVTLGGLSVALLGGLVALRPGGGETKQEQAMEPPV